MFWAEHFYSPAEESMRRLTYRQDYEQAGLTGRGFISGGRSGSFRFCVGSSAWISSRHFSAIAADTRVAVVMAHGHRVRLLEKVRQVAGDEGAAARKFEGPGLGRSLRALRCRPPGSKSVRTSQRSAILLRSSLNAMISAMSTPTQRNWLWLYPLPAP